MPLKGTLTSWKFFSTIHATKGLKDASLSFKTNVELCPLKISLTDQLLDVVFNDGTLHLFNMMG